MPHHVASIGLSTVPGNDEDERGGGPAEGLTRRALGGMKWTYGSTVAIATLQIGYTAVMGRLLADTDFGLIAMAQVFLNFGQHFANAGVASALVQKPAVSRSDIRVAITSSAVLGLLLAGGVVVAAPLAGQLFDTPDVVAVVRVMAAALLLQALGHTSVGLLRRDLRFKTLAGVEVAGHGVGYLAVGVGMALAGFGVWSLVAAAIGSQALRTIIAYGAVRHSLRPLMRWQEFKVLYGYGGRLSVISFLEFVGTNLDVLVIGRFAGQGSLGQWNRAALLITLPFGYAIGGLSKVLFPTFSKIQADIVRVRRGYLGAVGFTAALVAPTAAGMAAASNELIPVLLGPGWEEAATILPWLALTGVAGMLSHFGGIVCDATAELNRKLVLQLSYLLVLGAGLFLVRAESLMAIAMVVAGAQVLRHLLYMGLMSRVLGVTATQYRDAYLPAIATAAVVGAAVWGCSLGATATEVPAVAVLAVQMVVGAVVLLAALRRGPLAPIRRQLRERLRVAGLLDADGSRAARRLAGLLGDP
ncbi:N/A [soil metagenome]